MTYLGEESAFFLRNSSLLCSAISLKFVDSDLTTPADWGDTADAAGAGGGGDVILLAAGDEADNVLSVSIMKNIRSIVLGWCGIVLYCIPKKCIVGH